MQRKGCILKKSFSLLLSIIFLMIMAFIGAMVMSFSASSSHHSSNLFLDTKANLALKSSTAYAILALHGHNFKNGLIKEINLSYPFFNSNIKFHYFLTNCSSADSNCSKIITKDTNATVLVYVTVTSKLPNYPLRKVKVTLQTP